MFLFFLLIFVWNSLKLTKLAIILLILEKIYSVGFLVLKWYWSFYVYSEEMRNLTTTPKSITSNFSVKLYTASFTCSSKSSISKIFNFYLFRVVKTDDLRHPRLLFEISCTRSLQQNKGSLWRDFYIRLKFIVDLLVHV